jgi:thiol-disulfide isomerase/thioredoxin
VDTVQPLHPRAGRLTLVFLIFFAAAVAVGSALTRGGETTATSFGGPMEGQQAPEIRLTAFNGDDWTLSGYLENDGRPLFINLWASWCDPCRDEIPDLSAFASAHPEYHVVGVAVRDTEVDARAMADELAPSYLIGIDALGNVRDEYVGFGLPATFLIDSTGVVTAQIEGPVTIEILEDLTTG